MSDERLPGQWHTTQHRLPPHDTSEPPTDPPRYEHLADIVVEDGEVKAREPQLVALDLEAKVSEMRGLHTEALQGDTAALEMFFESAPTVLDALVAEVERMEGLCAQLRQEAQIHAGEARTQRATVHECYQAVGAQKGDWNGAQPIRDMVAERDRLKDELEALKRETGQ